MKVTEHILIIGTVWPEPDSSAAGSRMVQLIELFQSQNWKITFASAAADSEFMVDLKSINVEKVSIQLNNSSFDLFIKELQPTIVIFDRFMTEEQFGWRVAENCADAIRIIDTVDLHCLRAARTIALKEKRTFTAQDLFSEIAKREIASILRSDLSLIISEYEMKLLREYFKIDDSLLHYVPFMLDSIDATKNKWKKFEERNHFISIGNFLHEPNWNAVQFLKEEIWPLIRKQLPRAELKIYGAYPSQKVMELHKPQEGFYVMGRAKNALEVIGNARVLLAPLRIGAGLKGKLTDAMICGTPSVTTSIGAEAMHGNLALSGTIADDANEIANAAVKIYSDSIVWKEAQENGVKIINTIYNKKIHGEKLLERINEVQLNLEKHRANNFMGAMLMQQTTAASKYMSKWIEEKNHVKN